MLDATRLHHFRWRKKKVEQFIIPPTYFRKKDYSIVEVKQVADSKLQSSESSLQKSEVAEPKVEINLSVAAETYSPQPITQDHPEEPKISALSISSIRAKREMLENTKGIVKEEVQFPTETFTKTEMLVFWTKYANRLGDKGYKIMESLLLMGEPKLEGTIITHELPNDSSKIDFESEKNGLLGYLKGHLHNHDITIEVVVNESIEKKFAFTPIDKYNRLKEINPNLDVLRKTFDLEI